MKRIKIILTSFIVVLLFGSAASALNYIDPDWNIPDYVGNNGYEAVQVKEMYEFIDPPGDENAKVGDTNLLQKIPAYEATGRAAFFDGNDPAQPSTNIGQWDDGLLNGDLGETGEFQEWLIKGSDPEEYYRFDGQEFIDKSEFQDVDGDGDTDDPGWIYLGKQDGAFQKDEDKDVTNEYQPFSYAKIGGANGTDIGNLINISFEYELDTDNEIVAANWFLTPKDGLLDTLQPLLGNSFFDHLAIVLKSADYFAIYDLDFNKIFALEELGEEYFAPVKLSGTLNNSDLTLKNGEDESPQAISHISFWAHDPIHTAVVPEPTTLILLGSGLAGLAAMGIRRKKTTDVSWHPNQNNGGPDRAAVVF